MRFFQDQYLHSMLDYRKSECVVCDCKNVILYYANVSWYMDCVISRRETRQPFI